MNLTKNFIILLKADFLSDRFEVDNEDDDRTVVHLMIDQIEFANIIVLNKVDMVKPADLDRIKKTLKTLNPGAEIYPTNYSKVPLEKVLNTHKFNFEEAAKSPGWLKEMRGAELVPESEEYGISSFVFRSRKPFVPKKIYDLMVENFLLQERADGEETEQDENQESQKEPQKGRSSKKFFFQNPNSLQKKTNMILISDSQTRISKS